MGGGELNSEEVIKQNLATFVSERWRSVIFWLWQFECRVDEASALPVQLHFCARYLGFVLSVFGCAKKLL